MNVTTFWKDMTMSKDISLREAKAHLSKLLDRVEKGEEIIITRHGKPSAKMTSVKAQRRTAGALKGQIKMSDDFDQTDEEITELFEGHIS